MTAIALATIATLWTTAALLCLSDTQSPDAVVAQVLGLPMEVAIPTMV